jgi:hypothetical protein
MSRRRGGTRGWYLIVVALIELNRHGNLLVTLPYTIILLFLFGLNSYFVLYLLG